MNRQRKRRTRVSSLAGIKTNRHGKILQDLRRCRPISTVVTQLVDVFGGRYAGVGEEWFVLHFPSNGNASGRRHITR